MQPWVKGDVAYIDYKHMIKCGIFMEVAFVTIIFQVL